MSTGLRELSGLADLKQAEQLQWDVWGRDDLADPADLMLVIQHEGGLVAGAFENGRLMAYVFGFPTREPNIQHSHRLAVHPDARGAGYGVRLKWFQRDWCLARGIDLVRWTYDPLRAVNANLNINRLGAVSRTYLQDYYGDMGGINAGVPSDRLLTEWHLKSPRADQEKRAENAGFAPQSPPALTVPIPADFGSLLADNPQLALAERLRVRAALTGAFTAGLVICGFDPPACAYILGTPANCGL